MAVQIGNDKISKLVIGGNTFLNENDVWNHIDGPKLASGVEIQDCFYNFSEGILTVQGFVLINGDSKKGGDFADSIVALPTTLSDKKWTKVEQIYLEGEDNGGYIPSFNQTITNGNIYMTASARTGMPGSFSVGFKSTWKVN